MMPGRIIRPLVLCLIVAVYGIGGTAHAADPKEGKRIYDSWCVTCHGSLTSTTAQDAAPPLALILRNKTLSPAVLRNWLANPHPPMPNLSLGRIEIDNIVSYLGTLRPK